VDSVNSETTDISANVSSQLTTTLKPGNFTNKTVDSVTGCEEGDINFEQMTPDAETNELDTEKPNYWTTEYENNSFYTTVQCYIKLTKKNKIANIRIHAVTTIGNLNVALIHRHISN